VFSSRRNFGVGFCRSAVFADLSSQIKELLALPPTQKVQFERYSDSAASFIVLDPENTAVYKQLFRAAKAKLKLRIRLTTVVESVEDGEQTPPPPPPQYRLAFAHKFV